jgi:phosphoserine phosphatase
MPEAEAPVAGVAHPVDPDVFQARLPVAEDPSRPVDLVLLDMDGTLVDDRSSWEWVHHAFGVSNEENWRAYEAGRIDDHEFTAADIELWLEARPDLRVADVERALDQAPLMPGAHALADALEAAGPVVAIVSGGLDLLARDVADLLDLDLYAANGFRTGPDGEVRADPVIRVPVRDKEAAARALRETLDVPPERTAAMGNTRHDVSMFRQAGRTVAFAPQDDEVRAAADAVVPGKDLGRAVGPLLDGGGGGGSP